jgi:hypothetical protein
MGWEGERRERRERGEEGVFLTSKQRKQLYSWSRAFQASRVNKVNLFSNLFIELCDDVALGLRLFGLGEVQTLLQEGRPRPAVDGLAHPPRLPLEPVGFIFLSSPPFWVLTLKIALARLER